MYRCCCYVRKMMNRSGSSRGAHAHRSRGALVLALALVGCNVDIDFPGGGGGGDDGEEDPPGSKGQIDRSAMQAGAVVMLSGSFGTVDVPFIVPVPEGQADTDTDGDQDLEAELAGAVSLIVSSTSTGATVDLTDGTLVDGIPAAPGEWTWGLNGARNRATMTFFNSSSGGLTLKPDLVYDAMLSIASNSYVETEGAFMFPVRIVQE